MKADVGGGELLATGAWSAPADSHLLTTHPTRPLTGKLSHDHRSCSALGSARANPALLTVDDDSGADLHTYGGNARGYESSSASTSIGTEPAPASSPMLPLSPRSSCLSPPPPHRFAASPLSGQTLRIACDTFVPIKLNLAELRPSSLSPAPTIHAHTTKAQSLDRPARIYANGAYKYFPTSATPSCYTAQNCDSLHAAQQCMRIAGCPSIRCGHPRQKDRQLPTLCSTAREGPHWSAVSGHSKHTTRLGCGGAVMAAGVVLPD